MHSHGNYAVLSICSFRFRSASCIILAQSRDQESGQEAKVHRADNAAANAPRARIKTAPKIVGKCSKYD